MSISVECRQCEADFELQIAELLEDPTHFACPNCGASADPEIVEVAVGALDEAVSQLTRLSRKFCIELTLEAEELGGETEADLFTRDDEDALWTDEVEEEVEEE